MAAPVWVLSVDLQAKTATFATGMADAARAARSSFQSISSEANSMSGNVGRGTTNVRAAIGLLDNTIRGAHGAAMADLIREFAQTSIVMSALPFLPVVGGLLFLGASIVGVINKIHEYRQEQEKIGNDQTKLSTTINTTFQGLDERLLQAGIHADELRNNHLGALHKELALINLQGMGELVHSFETVAKAADVVFEDLKSHWYSFGIGADGAKHALDQFQTQYNALLAQGKDREATDLLKGTRDSAEKVLNAQRDMINSTSGGTGMLGPHVNYEQFARAKAVLSQAGIGSTQNEVRAQVALVDALNAQLGVESKLGQIKSIDSGNAVRSAAMEASRTNSEAARQSADAQLRMGELAVSADKATAQARLAVQHASAQERTASELEFAQRERDVQLAANQAQLAALDTMSKDYPNQVKAMHEKALEIEQQYQTQIARITAQGQEAAAEKQLQDLEESIRQNIQATREGSMARVAAIDAGLKREAELNMQSLASYRDLETQRTEAMRKFADEQLQQQIATIGAQEKVKEMQAQHEAQRTKLSPGYDSLGSQAQAQFEILAAADLYQIKAESLTRIAALQKQAGDSQAKELQATYAKLAELTQQYENQVAEIQEKASTKQNNTQREAVAKMSDTFAQGFMSVLEGHQRFAALMQSTANRVASAMISAGINQLAGVSTQQMADAKVAASNTYATVSAIPVVGPFLAPEAAAGAFAAVLAFAGGGVVPGVGKGDIVPAMLTPGEGVIPGGVMDGLSKMARNGGFSGNTTHVHQHFHYKPQIHALDGDSVERVLSEHSEAFEKHYHKAAARLNR